MIKIKNFRIENSEGVISRKFTTKTLIKESLPLLEEGIFNSMFIDHENKFRLITRLRKYIDENPHPNSYYYFIRKDSRIALKMKVEGLLDNDKPSKRTKQDIKGEYYIVFSPMAVINYLKEIMELTDKDIGLFKQTNFHINNVDPINDFEQIPITKENKALFNLNDKVNNSIQWVNTIEPDEFDISKNNGHQPDTILFNKDWSLNLKKRNWIMLGEPEYVNIGAYFKKGILAIKGVEYSKFKMHDSTKGHLRTSFSPNHERIEKLLGIKIEKGKYYEVKQLKEEKILLVNFNIKEEDN